MTVGLTEGQSLPASVSTRRIWRQRAMRAMRPLSLLAVASFLCVSSGVDPAGAAQAASGQGYWMVGADGGTFSFGAASFYGSAAGKFPGERVVAIANTLAPVTGGVPGYDVVTAAGQVATCTIACAQHGTGYFGSLAAAPNSPIVGITTDVQGYVLASANGTVYPFGNDKSYGSMAGVSLNAPIVGIADYRSGGNAGYWLVAADGGVFSFGAAPFYGSMGGHPLNAPIVGMVPTPDGGGYWLVAADGGVFSFGDAHFYGSMGGRPLNRPMVGIAPTTTGSGYWLVASDGGIFSFGNADFEGSMGGRPLNAPVVGMTTSCRSASAQGCS